MRLAGCRATPQWKCDTFEIISVLASTATTNITKKQHKNQTALKRNGEKSKMMSSSTEFIHSIRFYSCFCGRRRQLHACAMCGVYTISSTSVLPFRVHIFNIIFFLSRISFAAFKLYVCSTFIPVFRSTTFFLFIFTLWCFPTPRWFSLARPPPHHFRLCFMLLLYEFACIFILIADTFHQYLQQRMHDSLFKTLKMSFRCRFGT